jgi:hypothetical protein
MAPRAVPETTPIPIPPEIADFLVESLILDVATRTAALEPECMDAAALRLEPQPGLVTIYLAEALAGPTMRNLRDNGQLAVNASRPSDHRALQLKGVLVLDRPADEDDRAFVLGYLEKLVPRMGMVGLPHSVCYRMNWWPSRAVQFAVRDIFVQTPGPDAGRRLEAQGAPAAK